MVNERMLALTKRNKKSRKYREPRVYGFGNLMESSGPPTLVARENGSRYLLSRPAASINAHVMSDQRVHRKTAEKQKRLEMTAR